MVDTIKGFLKFPRMLNDFPLYEAKIHFEISNKINDIRILLLKIMKNVKLEDKRLLLKIKNNMDEIKSSFTIISKSVFNPTATTTKILSLHHESIIVIDFLLLDRFADFLKGIKKLEEKSLKKSLLLKNHLSQINYSMKKLEKLIGYREITQKIPPTEAIFRELEEEFSGDISYLNFLGVMHEYDELAKPLKGAKFDYYSELKRYFMKNCIDLIEQNKKSITFIEFLKFFENKFPGIEFEIEDMEKISKELASAGFVSLTQDSTNTPITLLLENDSTIQKEILEIATEKGYTTQEEIIKELSLPIEKSLEIIEKLEQSGLAVVGDYASGRRVYFPGMSKDEEDD